MVRPTRVVPMGISTTDEYYGNSNGNSNSPYRGTKSSSSFLPRNYSGRRQIVVAGSCFLLFLIILQTAVQHNDHGSGHDKASYAIDVHTQQDYKAKIASSISKYQLQGILPRSRFDKANYCCKKNF